MDGEEGDAAETTLFSKTLACSRLSFVINDIKGFAYQPGISYLTQKILTARSVLAIY